MTASASPPAIVRFGGEYEFLSNFHAGSVTYEGVAYPTAEHAFQAAKTTNPVERRQVAAAPTPSAAKRLGRHLELRYGWDEMKLHVMREVLAAKFADPELARRLLATGDANLVEGNTWHDNVWGSCTCDRPGCRGAGRNLLGLELVRLRVRLRAGIR